MKKALGIVTLLVVISACSKKGDDDPNYVPPVTVPFAYKVDGVRDTSVERIGEVTEFVTVKYLEGTREPVKLTVTGLPDGVTDSIVPGAAEPPYIASITFKAKKALEGSYPITITSSSITTVPVTYKMVLRIRPYSNSAVAFNGNYQESHSCMQDGSQAFPVYISPEVKAINRINIKGFWTKSWNTIVYADLNPEAKTVNIPAQVVNNVTFKGIGTYNDNEIVVNYTVKDSLGIVDESCTATFSQQ